MRVLVVGSSGFLGRLACAELVFAGHSVEGWSRRAHVLAAPARFGSFVHRRVDLLDLSSVLRASAPFDGVLLLAAHAVPALYRDERLAAESLAMVAHALEAIGRDSPHARVVLTSSLHVHAPSGAIIDETAPLAPAGAYGRSKLACEALALASGVDARIARLASHVGPGQPRGLFVPDLVERLRARPDGAMRIRMDGPDGERDIGDGRDGARALVALLALPDARGEVFHVAAGRVLRLSELARGLARRLGFDGAIEFAPGTSPRLAASAAKLARRTGWRPVHDLDATLDWIAADPSGEHP